MRILVIGGGLMGAALAKYFSEYIDVALYEKNPVQVDKLKKSISLQKVSVIDELTPEIAPQLVIEAVPEKLAIKQQVFAQLEEIFDEEVIFCTNTSSFLISDLAENMNVKERLIGTHFFSPADTIPLVEVVPSVWTTSNVVSKVMQFLKDTKKKPVALKREIEGFIANRLQSALAREAMSLVEKGIVSPDDVDFIAKWSIGMRLPFSGPVEQRDINGLDTHLAINEYVYPNLENTEKPLKILKDHVADQELGMKTGKGFYNWENVDTNKYLERKNATVEKLMELMTQLEEDQ